VQSMFLTYHIYLRYHRFSDNLSVKAKSTSRMLIALDSIPHIDFPLLFIISAVVLG